MCANPWCTMRFSPRFLNAFFFVGRPAFFLSPPSGGADASIASFFAINSVSSYQLPVSSSIPVGPFPLTGNWRPETGNSYCLLLRHRTLARPFARPRVRLRPLAADRQIAPMPQPAVAADFHQPLDVHRDFFTEIAFDAPLLLDDPADLSHVVFRQILDPDVRADGGGAEDVHRALPSDAVDVGESDLDALGSRKIDASNTCHLLDPCSFQLPVTSVRLQSLETGNWILETSLSLPLFMFLIRADHAHHAAAAHDLALVTDPFD